MNHDGKANTDYRTRITTYHFTHRTVTAWRDITANFEVLTPHRRRRNSYISISQMNIEEGKRIDGQQRDGIQGTFDYRPT